MGDRDGKEANGQVIRKDKVFGLYAIVADLQIVKLFC